MSIVNNYSDISVTCGYCGSGFSSAAKYIKELLELFNEHVCSKES